jgi:RNA polymerase sigma factor (sigma-70 family)
VPPSDADLLTSYTPEDFGEFYERHLTAVTAYLARRTRRPDILFDLVAETFARAYELRRSHDPRKGPAIGWLFQIARQVTYDAERGGQVPDAARTRLNMEPIALGDEALEAVRARGRADLIQALEALPESQRIVVIRRVLGEQEYPELSPHVGRSPRVIDPPEPKRRRRR